jgi:branched-chain amino acid transport system permease protein
VLGGLIVGIGETLLGGYVGFIGSDMTKVAALVIILAVLLLRPRGLFGSQTLERV